MLAGQDQPHDQDERMALIAVCRSTQRSVRAASLFVDAFNSDPALASQPHAVGDERSVTSYRGTKTQVIDAGGRRVIPSLNDSHIYVIHGGLNYNMELRWDGVTSLSATNGLEPVSYPLPEQGVWLAGLADALGPAG